eukprot:5937210-Alexandrium_andersonii.AAC.1
MSRDVSAILAHGARPERFHIGSFGGFPAQEEGTPSAGFVLPQGVVPTAPEAVGPYDRKSGRD